MTKAATTSNTGGEALGKARLFIPITKVDVVQRLVYGRITEEVVDKAREIFDYEGSKPYFEKWSGNIAKATGGKSVGNVRAMHGSVAAGKLTSIDFLDAEKAIDCCAKIVDDAEWAKVDEGVYTGFSMGGSYVKRWDDPDNAGVKRFIADPAEVSIVDNPCVPTAHFTAIKADGATEERMFKIWAPTNELVAAEAAAMAKAAGDETKWPDLLDDAREALVKRKGEEALAAQPADVAATAAAEKVEAAGAADPAPTGGPAAATPPEPAAGAPAAAPTGEAPQAEPAPAEPAKAATAWALKQEQLWVTPDGQKFAKKSDAKAHLDALQTIANSASPLAAAIAAAKASVPAPAEPDPAPTAAFKADEALALHGVLEHLDKAHGAQILAKGMYSVRSLSSVMQELYWLQQDAAWETESEGDNSPIPGQLAQHVAAIGQTLIDMTREEVAEMIANLKLDGIEVEILVVDGDAVITAAAEALDVIKADTALLTKAGARHSKADMKKIQEAHDSLTGLGAKCSADNADKAAAGAGEIVAKVATLEQENAALKLAQQEAVPQIEELGTQMAKMAGDLTKAQAEIVALKAAPLPMPTLVPIGSTPVAKGAETLGAGVVASTEGAEAEPGAVLKGAIDSLGLSKVQDLVMKDALSRPIRVPQ